MRLIRVLLALAFLIIYRIAVVHVVPHSTLPIPVAYACFDLIGLGAILLALEGWKGTS